jgi:transposase
MKFVATKTADQLDLQALHRVRERLVSQRTGIINHSPLTRRNLLATHGRTIQTVRSRNIDRALLNSG